MSEESQKVDEQPKLSPEEVKERKQKISKFYKDQIDFLTPQLEYERMVTEIDELRARSLMARVRYAQISNPPQEEEAEKEEKDLVMPEVATDKVVMTADATSKRTLAKS